MRVVLWFFLMLGVLLAGPEAWAAKKKNSPPPPPKAIYEAPMTVVIVRSSDTACEPLCPEWISAEGEITDATPGLFRNVFKQMGKKQLPIIIRSPGGSINAAIEIGRMVRQRKLDVGVGYTDYKGCAPNQKACKLPKDDGGVYRGNVQAAYAFCNSACPILLSGGVNRYASYGTTLGLHQPKTVWVQRPYQYVEHYRMVKGRKKVIDRKITKWLPTKTKVTFGFDKRLRKQLTSYYKFMGVDVAVLDESNKAAYKDINTITGLRAEELHLRTTPRSIEMLTAISVCNGTGAAAHCVKSDRKSDAELALLAARKSAEVLGLRANDAEMRFTLMRITDPSCEPRCPQWISAEGMITDRSLERFQSLVATAALGKVMVVLNSSGGDFDEALQLGRYIRSKGIDTAVGQSIALPCTPGEGACLVTGRPVARRSILQEGGRCVGACAFLYAGGKNRLSGAAITVHAPNSYRSKGFRAPAVELAGYFRDMGLSLEVMRRMWSIGSSDHADLAVDEVRSLGFQTTTESVQTALAPASCNANRQSYCVP